MAPTIGGIVGGGLKVAAGAPRLPRQRFGNYLSGLSPLFNLQRPSQGVAGQSPAPTSGQLPAQQPNPAGGAAAGPLGANFGSELQGVIGRSMQNPMGAGGDIGNWVQQLVQRALAYAQQLQGQGKLPSGQAPAPAGGGANNPAAAQVGAPVVNNRDFDAGAAGLGGLSSSPAQSGTPSLGGQTGYGLPAAGGAVPQAGPAASQPAVSQFANSIQNRAQSRVARAFTPGPNRVTTAKKAKRAAY